MTMQMDQALYSDAITALRRGQYEGATLSLHEFLRRHPRHVGALNVIGICYIQLANHAKAAFYLGQALALDATSASAFYNYGVVLRRLDKLQDAYDALSNSAKLDPHNPDAWSDRGSVLSLLGRYAEALADFDRAIALKSDMKHAWAGKGYALGKLDRPDEAILSYGFALRMDAALIEALIGRANAFYKVGQYQAAVADFAAALKIDPHREFLRGDLLNARAQICDWTGFDEAVAAIQNDIDHGRLTSGTFALFSTPLSAATHLACAKLYCRKTFPVGKPAPPALAAARRIKVAYVSCDFQRHATASLIAGLFEKHDRERFEIIGVSFGVDDGSEIHQRMVRSFDCFFDVRDRTDAQIAALIRDQKVDIAVDLKGYTTGCRPGIFAERAVPVQVNYLGYPGSMGAPFIDYVIADRVVVPPSEAANYSEKAAYLPTCYQVNDDRRPRGTTAMTRAEAGLSPTDFVFCCFNNNFKITPKIFEVWMRLLRQVDGSVLWLLGHSDGAVVNLRREAATRGIDPDRLVFAPRVDLESHLSRQRLADLFLDTIDYNAHTTASDALWVGLPVLTCMGSTFAGRVAASLLTTIGLPELIATDLAEYERLALELARHPERLAAIKAKLAANRDTSPLFDTTRFARDIEGVYQAMVELNPSRNPSAQPRGDGFDGIIQPSSPGS